MRNDVPDEKASEDEGHTGNPHLISGIVIVSAIAVLLGCAGAYLCIRLQRAERKLRSMDKLQGEPKLGGPAGRPSIQDPSIAASVVVGVPLAHDDDANQQTITNGEVMHEQPLTPRLCKVVIIEEEINEDATITRHSGPLCDL
jgi:hypothetical protein